MESITIGQWKLLFDRQATRAAFAGVPVGAPESCDCLECANFVAQRGRIYPPQAIEVFDRLGIDPSKESEIYHNYGDENGIQHYAGWFHFVGTIESGPEMFQIVDGVSTFNGESFGDGCELSFHTARQLIPDSFGELPVVQLEFTANLPWVLDTPASLPEAESI